MAMYSALRDAFNDLNKSVRDQANWEEQHAVDSERRETQRMAVEQNLQDQLLRRDVLKEASMRARDQITPKDTNVYKLLPNNAGNQKQIFTDPQWIKDSEQIMGGKWDPDVGGWRGEDGNVLQFNDYHMAKKMSAIEGLNESTFNGPAAWTEQGLAIDQKISDVRVRMKKESEADQIKSARELSDLQQQRSAINSDLTKRNMLRYYNRQYQNQTGKARFFTAMGDTVTAAIMQKRADHAQTNVVKLIEQIAKEGRGGKSIGTTSGHQVYAQASGYFTVGNKEKFKEKGQWVRNVSHNFKVEGDITRKLRDNETLVRDLTPTGTGGPKQTGALTFDQGQDNIAKAHTTTGALGQNIINPKKKGQVFAETQIFGAIVARPEYPKAHGRDHRAAQIQAQSIGRQLNNVYFKEKARGKAMKSDLKGRNSLVALILDYDPSFEPTFDKKGRVSNPKIQLLKELDRALLQGIDDQVFSITGTHGLGYVPFKK